MTKSILRQLENEIIPVFSRLSLEPNLAQVSFSDRPELGQFQLNGVLKAASLLGKSPRELAENIAQELEKLLIFQNVSVAGPGFINLTLKSEYLEKNLNLILSDEFLGASDLKGHKIVLDYGGPNVAKPLHVGHLRASIIGDCLRRVNQFLGAEVYGDIHLGDWGTPMGMLIAYLTELGQTEEISLEDLEKAYPLAALKYKEDPEFKTKAARATFELQNNYPEARRIWHQFIKVSLESIASIMNRLGVEFSWWYGESRYHDRIAPMLERLKEQKKSSESEGAHVVMLPQNGTKELPPLILVKSDGSYLYATTDLAAIEERIVDDKATEIQYVVDLRQSLHFEQLFLAARQTGIAPEDVQLKFFGFGTMNGPDGKPFKTRSGGVLKLSDLIEMTVEASKAKMQELGVAKDYASEEQNDICEKVGVAALKFADLINNRLSDYRFEIERFTSFEGKTGPYLIYSAVRMASIFRKNNLKPEEFSQKQIENTTEIELALLLALSKIPEVIEMSATQGLPHLLADQAFQIAQEYNRFYQSCNILHQENEELRNKWIIITAKTHQAFLKLLYILGIEVPERM